MKLHYPQAQFDIQSFTMSVANEGNLNDVWMVNLVRHPFIVRRPSHTGPTLCPYLITNARYDQKRQQDVIGSTI
jgi:hypothetical protein